MNRTRVLICGAEGLVGRRLASFCEPRCEQTIAASRVEMDITDRWRLESEIERLQPTVVVNAAAMSGVDACEKDPESAEEINAHGPANIAAACHNCGVRLIHLSTDYVFNGRIDDDKEYDEADPPEPVNVYGRTKLMGEYAVLERLVDAVVLRVSFVFGPGRATFLNTILAKARSGSAALPVIASWRSKPTYTEDICRAFEAIVESEETGVWHVAGDPAVDRAEFVRKLLEITGGDPARVVEIDEASLKLPAARPRATPLSTTRFVGRFGPILRSWPEAVLDYQRNYPAEFARS